MSTQQGWRSAPIVESASEGSSSWRDAPIVDQAAGSVSSAGMMQTPEQQQAAEKILSMDVGDKGGMLSGVGDFVGRQALRSIEAGGAMVSSLSDTLGGERGGAVLLDDPYTTRLERGRELINRGIGAIGEAGDWAADMARFARQGLYPLDTGTFMGEMEGRVEAGVRGVMGGHSGGSALKAHLTGDKRAHDEAMEAWRSQREQIQGLGLPERKIEDVFSSIAKWRSGEHGILDAAEDVAKWAAAAGAEMTPIVGSFMGAGAVGGHVGRLAGSPLGPAGQTVGGVAGSMVGSFALGWEAYAGDQYAELVEFGVPQDLASEIAIKHGAGASAVSVVFPGVAGGLMSRAFGATIFKRRVNAILSLAGIGTVTEGTAEAIAEAIIIAGERAAGIEVSDEVAKSRIVNAGAAGGLMGKATGTLTGATVPVGRGRQQGKGDETQALDSMVDEMIGHAEEASIDRPDMAQALAVMLDNVETPTDEQRQLRKFVENEAKGRPPRGDALADHDLETLQAVVDMVEQEASQRMGPRAALPAAEQQHEAQPAEAAEPKALPPAQEKPEQVTDPEASIVNAIDAKATPEEKVKQLEALTAENEPIVQQFLKEVDEQLGTKSKTSRKTPESILGKAKRPSILEKKPWHDVEHVRDSFRFKTVINALDDVAGAFELLRKRGVELVKIDTDKMLKPKEWGWRFAAFDLRMPNGQLVEWYMPLRELERAKKEGNHLLFEKWRGKSKEELAAQHKEYAADLRTSYDRYQSAWEAALERLGIDASAAEASWNSIAARLGSVTRSKESLSSSAVATPSTPKRQTPSAPRRAGVSKSQTSTSPVEGSSETIKSAGEEAVAISGTSTDIIVQKDAQREEKAGKLKQEEAPRDDQTAEPTADPQRDAGRGIDVVRGEAPVAGIDEAGAPDAADAVRPGERPGEADGAPAGSPEADGVPGREGDATGDAGSEGGPDASPGAGDGGADRADRDAGRRGRERASSTPAEDVERLGRAAVKRQPAKELLPADRNHRVAPDDVLAPGGIIGKLRGNIKAIELLHQLEREKRNPEPAEKQILAQYVGWGAIPQVFDRINSQRYEQFLDLPKHDQETSWRQHSFKEAIAWGKKWHKHHTRVKKLLTREQWERAAMSTLNAHYTSRDVISHGLWGVAERLGFAGGRVLENSAGIGHVIGLMPDAIAENSRVTAVELDEISGRMLAKLYPQATVFQEGFETAPLRNNTFDLVIGNVPFAKEGPVDKRYPNFSLHNYFYARSFDLLRPGGLMVAITSDSTMDSAASLKFREWANQRVDLVGAMRLPNNAFKENAGTEVTTDILIFRKRDGGAWPHGQRWLTAMDYDTGKKLEDGSPGVMPLNEYYHHRPEMLLGKPALEGTMYRADSPALVPTPGALTDKIDAAVDRLPANVANETTELPDTMAAIVADVGAKEFSFQIDEETGTIGQVEARELKAEAVPKSKQAMVKGFIGLRQQVKDLIRMERDANASDTAIERARKKLDKAYDAFVKKHGHINESKNRLVQDDPEFALVGALELVNRTPVEYVTPSGTQSIKFSLEYAKAPILSKRQYQPRAEPTKADTAADALRISLFWRNRIDIDWMKKLTGQENVEQQLLEEGAVFHDPASGLLTERDEYLSGNVKQKLVEAEAALETDGRYSNNVRELKAVQPARVPISRIKAGVGARWIPPKVYHDWINEVLRVPEGQSAAEVQYIEETRTFAVEWHWQAHQLPAATEFGGGGESATKLIQDLINLRDTTVYDAVADEKGKTKQVKNPEATLAAQAAQQRLKDNFEQWAPQSKHAPQLEDLYNDRFNTSVDRAWSAPPFDTYPNMAAGIGVSEHNRRAITRGMRESYLNAHGVGTGKTFVEIVTAMEWRRLGMATKPAIVVQNATVSQIVETFKKLYPGANILYPSKTDFETKNRKRLFAKIAQNDYDAVILAQSQFNLIADSKERTIAHVQQEIDILVDAKAKAAEDHGKNAPKVKDLQRSISALEKMLEKVLKRKTDDLMTFEELGIDGLLVDEAHAYKKLQFTTQMDNIKGLDKGASQRGLGLYLKARYVQERTGGTNVVLLTGTPVTNTLAEVWNMMRYVRPDLLEEAGIGTFDEFATTYTDRVTRMEMDGVGRWRTETRLTSFKNVKQLVALWKRVAARVTAEDVGLERPALLGGGPKTIEMQPGEVLDKYMKHLIERYQDWQDLPARERREKSAEPLVINNLARKAAIDIRMVDPDAADDPSSKINRVVDELFTRWKAGKGDKLAQVVFAELFQSSGDHRFNAFQDIKAKLVKRGVPAKEIAVIHDHDTDAKRNLLFERVNRGDVRVVMGTTEKLGVGVNIQQRLAALHHIDAPYRPADIEQREGRILRQGNTVKNAEILRYGVVRTFDAGAYDRLARKSRAFEQVLKGTIEGDTLTDLDDVTPSFEEAAAIISGDPLVREKFELSLRLQQLEALQREHHNSLVDTRRRVQSLSKDIEQYGARAKELESLDKQMGSALDGEDLSIRIGSETAIEGEAAVEGLQAYMDEQRELLLERATEQRQTINRAKLDELTINGVTIQLLGYADVDKNTARGSKSGISWEHRNLGESRRYGQAKFIVSSLRQNLEALGKQAEERRRWAESAKREREGLKDLVDRPFEQAEDLQETRKRLDEVEAELLKDEKAGKAKAETEAKPDAEGRSLLDKIILTAQGIESAALRRMASPQGFLGRRAGEAPIISWIGDLAIVAAARAVKQGARGAKAVNAIIRAVIQEKLPGHAKHFAKVRDVTRSILDRAERDGVMDPKGFEEAVAAVRKNPVAARLAYQAGVGEGVRRVKAKLPKIRAELAERLRTRQKRVDDLRTQLRVVINQELPMSSRGRFLAALDKVRTPRDFQRAMTRIETELARIGARTDWAELKRITTPAQLKKLTNDRRKKIVGPLGKSGLLGDAKRAWQDMKAQGPEGEKLDARLDRLQDAAIRLRESLEQIQEIKTEHENENTVIVLGQKRDASKLKADLVNRLRKMPQLKTPKGAAAARQASLFRRWLRWQATQDSLAQMIDGDMTAGIVGNSGGPAVQLLVESMWKAHSAVVADIRVFHTQMERIAKEAGFEGLADARAKISGDVGEANQMFMGKDGQLIPGHELEKRRNEVMTLNRRALTLGQAMEIFAKDPQMRMRERIQPYTFDEARHQPPFMLEADKRAEIEKALPAKLKRMVQQAKKLRDEQFRERMFQVHRELKGWEPAAVDDYWPIRINRELVETDAEIPIWRTVTARHWENSGFLKPREENVSVPAVIGDFLGVLMAQADASANVVHLSQPVRAAEVVFKSAEVKLELEARLGEAMIKRLDEIIKDSSGAGAKTQDLTLTDRTVRQWVRNVSLAKTQVNVRTWMKNIGSVFHHLAYLPDGMQFDALAYGLKHALSKEIAAEMFEHSAWTWQRYAFNVHSRYSLLPHEQLTDLLPIQRKSAMSVDVRQMRGMARAALASFRAGDFKDGFHNLLRVLRDNIRFANYFDSIPMRAGWAALKYVVNKQHPDWSEQQKLEWVSWEHEKLMRRTQNTFSATDSTGEVATSRRTVWLSPFTALRSDVMKKYNIVYQARLTGDPKREAMSYLGIMGNQLMSVSVTGWMRPKLILGGLAALLGWKLWDDWDREREAEKSMERATWQALREVAGIVTGGSQALEFLEAAWTEFYKGERVLAPSYSVAAELLGGLWNLIEGAKKLGADPDVAERWDRSAGEEFTRAGERLLLALADSVGLSISPTWWLVKGSLPIKGSHAELRHLERDLEAVPEKRRSEDEKARMGRIGQVRHHVRVLEKLTDDGRLDGRSMIAAMREFALGESHRDQNAVREMRSITSRASAIGSVERLERRGMVDRALADKLFGILAGTDEGKSARARVMVNQANVADRLYRAGRIDRDMAAGSIDALVRAGAGEQPRGGVLPGRVHTIIGGLNRIETYQREGKVTAERADVERAKVIEQLQNLLNAAQTTG